jgi:D-alanine-D-alanine ligase
MGKIVGLTYDLKTDYIRKDSDPLDIYAEFDQAKTVDSIAAALESGGNKVERIGNVSSLLKKINDLNVDIVFNIAEGLSGRNRESQVPLILEMFDIPFVGADALCQGLTLDKIMAKKIFIAEDIPTPRFLEFDSVASLNGQIDLKFPLMVKLRHEGSSKGMDERNMVKDPEALKQQIARLTTTYKQSALVEEFISGTEFTVAVIGNINPQAYPVVQVSIDGKTDLGEMFYTFARIESDRLKYICPAKISDSLRDKLQDIALRVYQGVDCRDFGRVDFRVDEKGNPYALEINPLPCLAQDDIFPLIAQETGITYNQIINKILDEALMRYGL